MQAAAITSRFLTGCSSRVALADSESVVSNDALLRHIVASHLIQNVFSQELFVTLANSLIQFAEQAYLRRDLDALEDVSRTLMNLPVDASRQIGLYYHALAINRKGQRDEADTLLETVADSAPITYRARAIQTLGTNLHDKGQLDEAVRFQLEALRAASDRNAHGLQTMLKAHFEIAIVGSLAGDHNGALSHFEKLWPLVNNIARQEPFYFYLYHNAVAVELGEAGRIEEAQAACKIALAAPFASAYPEWTETRQELDAKRTSASPSVVAINRAREAEPSPQVEPLGKPHRSRSRLSVWLASENTLQRFSIKIAPIATIAGAQIAQRILDRVLICIGPRAPPAHR
jgi:tetratricopeptide (TPR) repeat protein